MRKSVKILGIIGVIIIILSIPTLFIISNIIKMGEKPEPFNLDNAPKHIIIARNDLKAKLENHSFSWEEDRLKFLNFSQWMAENCPDILGLIKGWKQTVIFEIENSTYDMWWIIRDNLAIIEVNTNPPQDYDLLIKLSFKTFTDILRQDETPLSAFLNGDLTFEGLFDNALKVAQITLIVSATVMDTYSPILFGGPTIEITSDNKDLYIDKGLTLFPCINVTVNPDHIGEQHMSQIGTGTAYIVNHEGKIIAQLGNSGHSVHKFLNSTTIIMGGQDPGYIELWNYKLDKVETLEVPEGHHDLDYNPFNDTFMVLEYVYSEEKLGENNVTVIHDIISQYNWAGDRIWQWDPRIHFPFNATRHASLGVNEIFRGGVDWMHANSFVWDKNEDVIFLNVRNLDTLLKINYTTKEVIWDAGRNGEFTLFNKAGDEVDTLFCHTHGLERISSNRFIVYDNDLFNQSNPSTMTLEGSSGYSRFLEIEIDEENRIMREMWSWVPPNQSYYFPESGGDADRLPNGNTLGTFGGKGLVLNVRDPVILTEVTENGTIAWELRLPGVNDSYYWVHRVERFYEKPLISIHNQSINLNKGILWVNLSTWNTIKQEATAPGVAKIIIDDKVLHQESFEFYPQWQATTFEITLDNLPSNVNTIKIIIENNDGISNSLILFKKVSSSFLPFGPIMLIIGGVMVAVPSIIVFKAYRKTQRYPEQKSE
ncbi:MAG: aryl-sulfate sulfotransferase [Candidatus Hodarchaeota archaeon]